MMRSESIGKLVAALAKAQGCMEGAKKDAANPFFKSKYADLASVIDVLREPFAANGIAWTQFARSTETGIEVETMFSVPGDNGKDEFISEILALPVGKYDPQGIGSAITYAKRYSLQAMAGIPSEDDDGNAAVRSAEVAANSLSPAEQAEARRKNPQPPPVPTCNKLYADKLNELASQLGVTPKQSMDILNGMKLYRPRLSSLPLARVDEFTLALHRQAVSNLLGDLDTSLEVVRIEDSSVVGDDPMELDLDQCRAALDVLMAAKERGALVP